MHSDVSCQTLIHLEPEPWPRDLHSRLHDLVGLFAGCGWGRSNNLPTSKALAMGYVVNSFGVTNLLQVNGYHKGQGFSDASLI